MICKTWVIYGLVDPNTNQIRYVGKSSNIAERYKSHLSRNSLKAKTHKNNWIKSLLKNNQKPYYIIIKSSFPEEVNEDEIQIIENFSKIYLLTNIAKGGTGGNTGKSFLKWKPIRSIEAKTGIVKYYKNFYDTIKDGFIPTKVCSVCKGRRKSHQGHIFEYVEKYKIEEEIIDINLIKVRSKELNKIMINKILNLNKEGFKGSKIAKILNISRHQVYTLLNGKTFKKEIK